MLKPLKKWLAEALFSVSTNYNHYKAYLLTRYEDTYFPEKIINAGRAVYIERNFEMINKSKFCVICYDEANLNGKQKSGTKIAYEYAVKHSKKIINLLKE